MAHGVLQPIEGLADIGVVSPSLMSSGPHLGPMGSHSLALTCGPLSSCCSLWPGLVLPRVAISLLLLSSHKNRCQLYWLHCKIHICSGGRHGRAREQKRRLSVLDPSFPPNDLCPHESGRCQPDTIPSAMHHLNGLPIAATSWPRRARGALRWLGGGPHREPLKHRHGCPGQIILL